MPGALKKLVKSICDNQAQAIVEFVITLPIFMILFFGSWEIYNATMTKYAALEAARYGIWEMSIRMIPEFQKDSKADPEMLRSKIGDEIKKYFLNEQVELVSSSVTNTLPTASELPPLGGLSGLIGQIVSLIGQGVDPVLQLFGDFNTRGKVTWSLEVSRKFLLPGVNIMGGGGPLSFEGKLPCSYIMIIDPWISCKYCTHHSRSRAGDWPPQHNWGELHTQWFRVTQRMWLLGLSGRIFEGIIDIPILGPIVADAFNDFFHRYPRQPDWSKPGSTTQE